MGLDTFDRLFRSILPRRPLPNNRDFARSFFQADPSDSGKARTRTRPRTRPRTRTPPRQEQDVIRNGGAFLSFASKSAPKVYSVWEALAASAARHLLKSI